MFVLNVTYKCKPGMAKAFLESIQTQGIDAAVRAEDGNLKYDYYFPADGGDELFLLEKWRDADALAAHPKQPHMQPLGALKAEYVNETIIEKYEVR